LLEAFAAFTSKVDGEFFLRIAGSGKMEKALKQQAVDLGIFDRVSFLGYVNRERMRDEMQRSSAFILSSRTDSFAIVLVEAMMTGMPVIATRSGGPADIVNSGNGILAETENVDSLEKAMEKMYFEYVKFSPVEIRQNAESKYSIQSVAHEFHQLIREVMDE